MTALIAKYRKFIVAAVGAAVTLFTIQQGQNSTFVRELVAVATALGVYVTPNG